jgi:hypothetical protein
MAFQLHPRGAFPGLFFSLNTVNLVFKRLLQRG